MPQTPPPANDIYSTFRGAYAVLWMLTFAVIFAWVLWFTLHHADSFLMGAGFVVLGFLTAGMSMIFLGGVIRLLLSRLFARAHPGFDYSAHQAQGEED